MSSSSSSSSSGGGLKSLLLLVFLLLASLSVLFFLFTVATAADDAEGQFKWAICGNDTEQHDLFSVKSIQIVPNPPVLDHNFTISISGMLKSDIKSGIVHSQAAVDNVGLWDMQLDLCSLFDEFPCPFLASPAGMTLVQTEYIPPFAPEGSYAGRFDVRDQNGNRVTCIEFAFDLSW